MLWKTTLLILSLSLVGYFIFTYFNLVNNYCEIHDLLPIPNNIKKIIKYVDASFSSRIRSSSTHFNNHKSDEIFTEQNNDILAKQKRRVTPLQKKIVASNQQWKCNNCRSILDYTYEVDHITPLYQGGGNNTENLQALCRNCHGKKTLLANLV